MFSRKRVLMGVIGIVLATPLMADSCGNSGGTPAGGGGTAATSGASGAAAKGPVAVGTVMTSSDGKSVTVSAFGPAPPSGNEFETPAAGKECVQLTLDFKNGGTSEWSLPEYEVGVVDAGGQKYSTSSNCGSSGDSISSLVAGGHATAKDLFEVPLRSALNASWVPSSLSSEVYQTKLR